MKTAELPAPVREALLIAARYKLRQQLQIGLIFIVLGLAIGLALLFAGKGEPSAKVLPAALLGGGIAAVGLPFVLLSLRAPEKVDALRSLTTRPFESIVWLRVRYYRDYGSNHVHTALVTVGYDDGHLAGAALGVEPGEDFFAWLRARAPQATIGDTPEILEQFMKAPQSLRVAA